MDLKNFRKLAGVRTEADRSVLGYSTQELAGMDPEERARTLYELLNQAADLAEAVASAFKADLRASGTLDSVKSAARDLIQASRKAIELSND